MLSCKISAVELVLLFCRQVFMFLNTQDETLDVSFKGKDGEGSYTAFATTVTLKCNQQESSGEPEPGVNDSQSSGSVEPELEEVSVEHRIIANQCNTVTNADVTTTGSLTTLETVEIMLVLVPTLLQVSITALKFS